jgi:thiamine-monophosphate kinase
MRRFNQRKKTPSLNEFDWIETYLKPLAGPEGLNLLDDAALMQPPSGHDLVLTQDTMVEGVHFLPGEYGAGTAERLLIANLSDLAAKGARPLGYLLSVVWPKNLPDTKLRNWMGGFTKGLESLQQRYDFSLFGGDTVKADGPFTVTASFIGAVPSGEMVKRSGAEEGDIVWVTGTIGDAHLGLLALQKHEDILSFEPSGEALWHWEKAFRKAEPRLLFRKLLRQYATACADVSDGVLSEAAHIAKASKKHIELDISCCPISNFAQAWCEAGDISERLLRLVTGGEDFELLFTAKASNSHVLAKTAKEIGLPVTKIGRVGEGKGLTVYGSSGEVLNLNSLGFTH